MQPARLGMRFSARAWMCGLLLVIGTPASWAQSSADRPSADRPDKPGEFKGHTLQMDVYGSVELKNSSKLIDHTKPFTVELWVRFYPEANAVTLIEQSTWKLQWNYHHNVDSASFQSKVGGGLPSVTRSPRQDYVWRHVAAVGDGKQVVVFLDGKRGEAQPIGKLAPRDLRENLRLGLSNQEAANSGANPAPEGVWQQEVRLARFSSVARYYQDFVPAKAFPVDAATLALLDFSENQGEVVKDRSGKGHDGAILRSRWSELPGEPPRVSAGPYAVRLQAGEHIEVPLSREFPIVTLSRPLAIEMWCRWDIGAQGMQWFGPPASATPVPGMFWIHGKLAEQGPVLEVTYLDKTKKTVKAPVVRLPTKPDVRNGQDEWHHLLVTNVGAELHIIANGMTTHSIEHNLNQTQPVRASEPGWLVVGDPQAKADNDSYLDIRGFRVSAGRSSRPFVTPRKLAYQRDTRVLWDLSKTADRTLPDLTQEKVPSRIVAATWLNIADNKPAARFALGQSFRSDYRSVAEVEAEQHKEPGTVSSELVLYATDASGEALAAPRAELRAPQMPTALHDLFLHELLRQGVLLTVREELGLTTRDAVLGETGVVGDALPSQARLVLTTAVSSESLKATLTTLDAAADAPPLWQESLALQEFHEPEVLAQVETWSRIAWPAVLRKAGFPQHAREPSKAMPAPHVEASLKEFNFYDQFAAVRALHRQMREEGSSPALEGALARGYVNLGLLTDFHWNYAYKACHARGLLYAQRALAALPGRPGPAANRAYAWALAGYHQHALEDLKAANHPASMPWTKTLEAYLHCDVAKLGAMEDASVAGLAKLLRYLAYEKPPELRYTLPYGEEVLQQQPFCFRVVDGMYDLKTLGVVRRTSEMAPAMLQASLVTELPELSQLPKSVKELAALQRGGQINEAVTLVKALRAAGEASIDTDELSWQALAQFISETQFVHVWNLAISMRFQLGLPTAEYFEFVRPLVAEHPQREYLEIALRTQSELDPYRARFVKPSELALPLHAQVRVIGVLFHDHFGERVHLSGPRPRVDRSHADLMQLAALSNYAPNKVVGEKLLLVSPHHPAGALRIMESDPGLELAEVKRYEQKFGWHPAILHQLTRMNAFDPHAQLEVLKKRVEVAQDYSAYAELALYYKLRLDLENWRATLEAFLKTPPTGLEHARARVEIAEHLMAEEKWDEALPYANAAAASYAEWAMWTAVKCYEGQGDLLNAELWIRRIEERYGRQVYAEWLKKHGLKPGDPLPGLKDARPRQLPDGPRQLPRAKAPE